MTNNDISIVLVSYKDKNLADAVRHIKSVTDSDNFIQVFDQHPIDHTKDFSEIENCFYEHKIWDDMHGPAYRRSTKIHDSLDKCKYVCVLSADVTLSPGWDKELIGILENKNIIISGSGKARVTQKDLFSLSVKYLDSDDFNITQMIDRNFIFAKAEAFSQIRMPDFLKYNGENEYYSLAFISNGYDILSVPRRIYSDNYSRSVENTYHTFSSDHNYNVVVDLMNGINVGKYKVTKAAANQFLYYHNLVSGAIKKLPYATNDVEYDPYNLEMHEIGARKFLSGTKAVY